MIRNQKGRRNVSTFVMVELGLKLEDLLTQKGIENKITKSHSFENLSKNEPLLLQNSAKALDREKENSTIKAKINTREEISKFANTSHDTVAKVKKIKEKAPEDVLQKVKTGEISINQAYTTIKREEKEQKRNEEVKENTEKVSQARSIDDLKGLFKTIVIDPPWDWGDEEDVNQMGRVKPDYATIPYEDLLKYPDSTEKLRKLRKLLFCNVSSIVFHI